MKYEVQISRLAVVCVLCTSAISGAFAAASVRSLGGAGTYTGTSAASTGGAINAVRAGSMRVTPSTGASSASSSAPRGTTTTGRVATSPRLSIGKYLGGGTSVSGGSSIKNQKPGSSTSSSNTGGSMNPGVMAELESRVGELEGQIANVYTKDDVDATLSDKQNVLTPVDDYIVIDNDHDEIYLNKEALENDLSAGAGRDIEIGADETGIWWRYVGETEAESLISWNALRTKFDSVTTTDMNNAIQDAISSADFVTSDVLSDYVKVTDLDNYVTSEELGTYVTDADVKTALEPYVTSTGVADYVEKVTADYAKTADVANTYATQEQVNKILAGDADLTGYAKTADVNTALAGKAAVGASYTKDESDAKYLTEHQSLVDYAKTESVKALATQIDGVSAVANKAGQDAATAESAATAATTAANDAAAMASAAKSTADTAKTTADAAKTAADGAVTSATSATTIATEAKTAAEAAATGLAAKADKATTLAGYGITDAYTKAEVEAKIAEAGTGDINLEEYAKTEYVNTELAKKANSADLGALAKKNTISNADVADDAAIAKEKLADDVQASLARADQAVTVAKEAPKTGDYVLAVSNGQKGWFEVVTKLDAPKP